MDSRHLDAPVTQTGKGAGERLRQVWVRLTTNADRAVSVSLHHTPALGEVASPEVRHGRALMSYCLMRDGVGQFGVGSVKGWLQLTIASFSLALDVIDQLAETRIEIFELSEIQDEVLQVGSTLKSHLNQRRRQRSRRR